MQAIWSRSKPYEEALTVDALGMHSNKGSKPPKGSGEQNVSSASPRQQRRWWRDQTGRCAQRMHVASSLGRLGIN